MSKRILNDLPTSEGAIRQRSQLRKQLARDVRAWKAKGNKIETVEFGRSAAVERGKKKNVGAFRNAARNVSVVSKMRRENQ